MNYSKQRDGFANILLMIAVMVVLAVGYSWWMQKSILDVEATASAPTHPSIGEPVVVPGTGLITRSAVYIYGPELNKVKVSLVSADEKTDIVPASFCGGKAGSKEYGGHYKLTLDPKTATWDTPGGNIGMKWGYSGVDLGALSFAEGTPWDGVLVADTLEPNGFKNFIILKQYATCNGFLLSIFGYDFETGKLMRFKFAGPGASSQDSLFVSDMKKSKDGNLFTSSYDNTSGTWTNLEWVFDPSAKVFQPSQLNG
jgi:hypothetical protein